MTELTVTHKRKRGRSPGYPAINVREAIERATTLYDREGKHPAPINAILAGWGYSPGSGRGLVTLAALKKFGLLIEQGSGPNRKARLSEDALSIILDKREDSEDRLKRIQSAALRPLIHRQLWSVYGAELPSQETLRYELQANRGFTDRAVREFIPQYRQTIEFAKLAEGDKLSGETEDKEEEEDLSAPVDLKTPQGMRAVQIPITPTKWATLQAAFPLTEFEWNQMKAVLEAMKPAIVTSRDSEETLEESEQA